METAGSPTPDPHSQERSFPRRIDALDQVFGFVTEALGALGVNSAHEFTVNLVVEEIFTNLVKYNRQSTRDISLRILRDRGKLIMRLTDFDVDKFDLTQAPEVDIHRPLSERTPGGLGIHLVRRMTESLSYQYEDRTSTIEMAIRLDPASPHAE
jgi:anti-sigma regulatory factor (Ser/Thr protein kinase)